MYNVIHDEFMSSLQKTDYFFEEIKSSNATSFWIKLFQISDNLTKLVIKVLKILNHECMWTSYSLHKTLLFFNASCAKNSYYKWKYNFLQAGFWAWLMIHKASSQNTNFGYYTGYDCFRLHNWLICFYYLHYKPQLI